MSNSGCKNLIVVTFSATVGFTYAVHWFHSSTLSDPKFPRSKYIAALYNHSLPVTRHQVEDDQKTSSSVSDT